MPNNSAQIRENYAYYHCNEALLWILEKTEYVNEGKVKSVEIGLHDLPRIIFDRLPGNEMRIPASMGNSEFWVKKFQETSGIELHFFTYQPPIGE